MTTLDVLRAARASLGDESISVSKAISDAFELPHDAPVLTAYYAVVQHCRPLNLGHYAETHTRDEVLALFDQAIAAEEAKGASHGD
jgi:hypothetical protein